jgi:hypothetical protein
MHPHAVPYQDRRQGRSRRRDAQHHGVSGPLPRAVRLVLAGAGWIGSILSPHWERLQPPLATSVPVSAAWGRWKISPPSLQPANGFSSGACCWAAWKFIPSSFPGAGILAQANPPCPATGGAFRRLKARAQWLTGIIDFVLTNPSQLGSKPFVCRTGPLTQSVEYLPFKQRVAGSSPARPTTQKMSCVPIV